MPKNEIAKTEKAVTTVSGAQALQVKLINEIEAANKQTGAELTEYGKRCIINAIGGLVQVCKGQNINMQSLDPTLLRLQLANVGYLELNYSASEIYFDLRKTTVWSEEPDPNTGKKTARDVYQVTIKPQGIGNEQLTRKYGVGLKPNTGLRSPWLVREGDEFEYPQFDGIKVTPPKWRMKNPDGKVILVVYCAEKVDGDVEYLMATRESVKPNIVAQIRQNTMYSFKKKNKDGKEYQDKQAKAEFYEKLNEYAESHSLQELLDAYADYVNPTYTSGGSKEAMIIRKMKNNALKNYPKDYGQSYVVDAAKEMYEDRDDSLNEPPAIAQKKDVIEQVEEELDEQPQIENAPKDFTVTEDGEIVGQAQEAPRPHAPVKPSNPAPEQTPQEESEEPEPEEDEDGDDDYGI